MLFLLLPVAAAFHFAASHADKRCRRFIRATSVVMFSALLLMSRVDAPERRVFDAAHITVAAARTMFIAAILLRHDVMLLLRPVTYRHSLTDADFAAV